MKDLTRLALLGAAAGAAGTTALKAVTYLDMAVRGRPSSSRPKDTVEKLSAVVHVRVPGDDDVRQNRIQGLGPLTGIAAGVGTGALLGLGRGCGWRPSTVAARSLGEPIRLYPPVQQLCFTGAPVRHARSGTGSSRRVRRRTTRGSDGRPQRRCASVGCPAWPR